MDIRLKSFCAFLQLIFLSLLLAACSDAPEQTLVADILIKGGTLVDGTADGGDPDRVIEIVGEKISYVGADRGTKAKQVIDASGLIVSPGFIDPHTHADSDLLDPERSINAAYLHQGVTTVFVGNDGVGKPLNELKPRLQQGQIGTHVALWAGHGNIRRLAMGAGIRAPSAGELQRMEAMVRDDMQAGALGLSTGLFYAPGSYSQIDEVIALSRVAAEYGGIYESHLRDESDYNIGLLAAVDEALAIGVAADIPVHIAHIKALGPAVHGQSAAVVERVEAAQARGLRVTADQYPWLASGTRLSNALIPRALMAGGRDQMRLRLQDPSEVNRVRVLIEKNLVRRGGPDALLITGESEYQGKTLAELAESSAVHPIDKAVEIVVNGDPAIASFMMAAEDLERFIQKPWVVTSSDGSNGHPRKFASFPKKYQHYVVGKPLLSLAEFVHRSSGLTAEIFGLCDRGTIEPGKNADIILWHPQNYQPMANYESPQKLASGIEHLLIMGTASISDGSLTGSTAGQVFNLQACK